MRRLAISFSILILTFIWIYHTAATEYNNPINSIIGDISFVNKFGTSPTHSTDQNLRIKTHLEYSEKLLRNNPDMIYSGEKKVKRRKALDHLHNYWNAGLFPNNNPSNSFIDAEGRISAIGYLIEKISGQQTVERISDELETQRTSLALNKWILNNGLTPEEAAILQPSY